MQYLSTPLPLIPSTSKRSADNELGLKFKALSQNTFFKDVSSIDCISFSANRLAVTSGLQVQLFNPRTLKIVKTISRFKETARSGTIRSDGKLLMAGDDGGSIQVFDLASRAILRTIKEHSQPVHTALFSPNKAEILSSSDDGTVRTFDLSTAAPLSTFAGHQDYVRTASFMPNNPSLYLSGSYDATVKIWDARLPADQADTRTFSHGYPVECVLVHSSGSIAISAGGPLIKIWDLLSGSSKPLKALSNHQKTVTKICWADAAESCLLSAGLDGLVKAYSAKEGMWKVGHTMRFGGSLLSMGVSPSSDMLVVGAADGQISIKAKPSIPGQSALKKRQGRMRDITNRPDKPDEIVFRSSTTKQRKRQPRLHDWDRLVKSFRYSDALDSVLSQSRNPKYVIALLNELKKINRLEQAFGARNDLDLQPILRFCNKQISDPRWGSEVAAFVQILINMYDRALGRSELVDKQFQQLRRRVQEELAFQDELRKVKGALDMIFSATTTTAGSN